MFKTYFIESKNLMVISETNLVKKEVVDELAGYYQKKVGCDVIRVYGEFVFFQDDSADKEIPYTEESLYDNENEVLKNICLSKKEIEECLLKSIKSDTPVDFIWDGE